MVYSPKPVATISQVKVDKWGSSEENELVRHVVAKITQENRVENFQIWLKNHTREKRAPKAGLRIRGQRSCQLQILGGFQTLKLPCHCSTLCFCKFLNKSFHFPVTF